MSGAAVLAAEMEVCEAAGWAAGAAGRRPAATAGHERGIVSEHSGGSSVAREAESRRQKKMEAVRKRIAEKKKASKERK